MSDPVSNAEIEDVLSSIRRLISESSASEEEKDPPEGEKLVLTPAFRVHGSESKNAEIDDEPRREPVLELVHPINKPASGPTKSVDEVPIFARQVSPDPVPDAPQESAREGHIMFSHTDPADLGSDPTERAETERDADPAGDFRDWVTETIEERFAEMEHAVDKAPDAWEPDEGEETAQSEVLMFHAARLKADVHEAEASATGLDEWTDVEKLEDKAPLSARGAEPTPDPKEYAGLRAEIGTSVGAVTTPGSAVEIVGDETDIIDEEIVQAMVSRLVREELQGEVGEKITRSIRRFIRREIEQALTLKGLE